MQQKKAMSMFLDYMKSISMVYEWSFRDLLEAHEHVVGDLLERKVDLDITSPLYHVRNERPMDNSSTTSSRSRARATS